ncbi:MAG: diaminopimelate dehydrogenase [Acutalibacteraceae bacterium]
MKFAVAGYGGLGKAVVKAIEKSENDELYAVFSRREKEKLNYKGNAPVYPFYEAEKHAAKVDVLINCMGSAFDLPKMTPFLAKFFNQVDSFDTHAKIQSHFEHTDKRAKEGRKLTLICAGWDPGLFSLARLYLGCAIPCGADYTFWGEGVSRGHTNAIKQIPGVVDAVQYTVPVSSVVKSVRAGEMPTLKECEMHKRVCYVVPEVGADTRRIAEEIKNMPEYFSDYDTTVNFIDYESFLIDHSRERHGGSVIRCDGKSLGEFSLKLSSNTAFTADVLISFARAVGVMSQRGETGCVTPFDVRPKDLFALSNAELMKRL